MKRTITFLITGIMLLVAAFAVGAVQFGEPDGNAHPQVGIMVAVDYNDAGEIAGAWRCSGTMISPTVYLTAGHCTYGADVVNLWFVPEIVAGLGWPFSSDIQSTNIQSHPQYVDNAFYLYDVGVVILDEEDAIYGVEYGTLPAVGFFDTLMTKRGQKDTSFTVVGYGLQSVVPTLQRDLVRHRGEIQLIDINGTAGIPAGVSATFTNSPGKGNGEGGICSGDSGGPIFHSDSNMIAAITSFGLNVNCRGIGGGYRIDKSVDLGWIQGFLN